tara:strand:+ start:200 stop:409 length:210 start_codon:yes stop_codon:yes gene_type:complete
MTIEQFKEKHNEWSYPDTNNVLMRIASNLSDLHIEKTFFTDEEMDNKLNALKKYIFDYQEVLRKEKENV